MGLLNLFIKSEGEVDWRARRDLQKRVEILKQERDATVTPLRQEYERLLRRETELSVASQKLHDAEHDFSQRIFQLEKSLRQSAPTAIEGCVKRLRDVFAKLPGKIKVENQDDKFRGSTTILSNRAAISTITRNLERLIEEAEELKISIPSEEDLETAIKEIEARAEMAIESELQKPLIVEGINMPLPVESAPSAGNWIKDWGQDE